MKRSIFFLIPDGTGIRNFLYTDCLGKIIAEGADITVWAHDDLTKLISDKKINTISLPKLKETSTIGDLQKKAWQKRTLVHRSRKFRNPVYLSYIFPLKWNKLNAIAKNLIEYFYFSVYRGQNSIGKLKKKYLKTATKTDYYNAVLQQLIISKPNLLFCTSQRSSSAFAPVEAARLLGIPTCCFIYSWDNMPKATFLLETDYYLVWSEYMKNEILKYHSEVRGNQIFVVGTPQFEPYFNERLLTEKIDFASRHNLRVDKKWVCFSGDDITTSPYDAQYLSDFCECVYNWNLNHTDQLHIVFRRSPVDLSGRYDEVLLKYKEIITAVSPVWKALNSDEAWNTIIPLEEDTSLLLNTALHCEAVVNVGSTMAFDFSVFNKPCIYINYNIDTKGSWDVKNIYKYIHFQSMPSKDVVIWVNGKSDWQQKLAKALYDPHLHVTECQKWHTTICEAPFKNASDRITKVLTGLLKM